MVWKCEDLVNIPLESQILKLHQPRGLWMRIRLRHCCCKYLSRAFSINAGTVDFCFDKLSHFLTTTRDLSIEHKTKSFNKA